MDQRLYGFFSPHGDNNAHLIEQIMDIAKNFFAQSERAEKIIMIEDATENQLFCKKVFKMKNGIKDLIDLRLESESKHNKLKKQRKFYTRVLKEYRKRGGNVENVPTVSNYVFHRDRLLSSLLQKVKIRVLYEGAFISGDVAKLSSKLLKSTQDSSALNVFYEGTQDDIESMAMSMTINLLKLGNLRDELAINEINRLLSQYQSLDLFVMYGTKHQNIIKQFQNNKNVKVGLEIVGEEPKSKMDILFEECFQKGIYSDEIKGMFTTEKALGMYVYFTMGPISEFEFIKKIAIDRYDHLAYKAFIGSLSSVHDLSGFIERFKGYIKDSKMFVPLLLSNPELYQRLGCIQK